MSEEFTGYTASFRPGGSGYDSPLVVVRANSEAELLDKLGVDASDPDGPCELGTAIASFHDKLRRQFEDVVGVGVSAPAPKAQAVVNTPVSAPADAPIWASTPPGPGLLTPNPDGTYPGCVHSPQRKRKPWTSPRTGKQMLFCSQDKGAPGSCPTVTL